MRDILLGFLIAVVLWFSYITYKREEAQPVPIPVISSPSIANPTPVFPQVIPSPQPIPVNTIMAPVVIPSPTLTDEPPTVVTCKETKVYIQPIVHENLVVWTMPAKFSFVVERYSGDYRMAKVFYPGISVDWWVLTESFTSCP